MMLVGNRTESINAYQCLAEQPVPGSCTGSIWNERWTWTWMKKFKLSDFLVFACLYI
jgi:hypothetical protein